MEMFTTVTNFLISYKSININMAISDLWGASLETIWMQANCDYMHMENTVNQCSKNSGN